MDQQLINALVLGSVYTLFAIGLSLEWGTLNILNLAHGAIFMSGAFIAYLMTKHSTLPLYVLLPAAMLGTGALSLVLEWIAFRSIRARAKSPHQAELSTLIASVGAGGILVAAAEHVTAGQVVTISTSSFASNVHRVGPVHFTNVQALIVILATVLSVAVALSVKRSRYGRALRALACDRDTCGLVGVNAGFLSGATMIVGGMLAGLAGVLLAVNLSAFEPDIGDSYLLKAFAAIVLGGVGSVGGAVLGAFVLAAGETLVVAYGPSGWKDALAFVIIIALLLFRPRGLFAAQTAQRA